MATFIFNESPWGDGNPSQFNLFNFEPRVGLYGPQIVTTWDQSEWPPARVMIRRKLFEFPRDQTDGVLTYDNASNPTQATCAGDIGADLLPANAAFGDNQFWYERAFVIPAARELEDQFGGDGVQLATVSTTPVDMQIFDRMTIYVTNSIAPTTITVEAAPTAAGPWTTVTTSVVVTATTSAFNVPGGHKFIRVLGTNVVDAYFAPQLGEDWFSSDVMSKAVLVFKTGKHMQLWERDLNLPVTYWAQDIDQSGLLNQAIVECETFKPGAENVPEGIMQRFLTILALELDRADAYTRSLMSYAYIQHAPPEYLQHIAYELGWPLDTSKDLQGQREELFRVAFFWKRKGSIRLYERVMEQETEIVPALLEGAGRVIRAANMDLF